MAAHGDTTPHDPNTTDAEVARRIEALRAMRAAPKKPTTLAGPLADLRRQAARAAKRTGDTVEAWRAAAPEDLVEGVRVEGWRRGRLQLAVADRTTRAALDQWLRAGGRNRLAEALGRSVPDVAVRISTQI